ncbi:LarC family nickel insertion protein [Brevibacillus sp. SYP-B805]|nr:LarC family nickel insertion protein [Brevibacillus sp. SYP-B805]
MAVGSGCGQAAERALSPLALLWLKAMGVRFLPAVPPGVVRRVAAGEGIAVLEIGHEGAVPRVREERRHGEEHIDEGMVMIQANLDDASPEWMAYAMERLLAAGANDVSFLPMTMKKSRPGMLLQVLCYQSDLEMMKSIVFTETTTFGLRYFPVAVHRLGRRFATVATRWGDVRVKIGFHRGERVQVSPEYEMCARLAKEAGVPLQTVYEEARRLAQEMDA